MAIYIYFLTQKNLNFVKNFPPKQIVVSERFRNVTVSFRKISAYLRSWSVTYRHNWTAYKVFALSSSSVVLEVSERKHNHSNMESKVDQNWAFDAFNDGSISKFVQLLNSKEVTQYPNFVFVFM